MNNITICKVPKEGSNNFYTLQVQWNENSFDMLILENESAWTGNVSEAQLNDFCKLWDFRIEDYIHETRNALSTPGGFSQFSYIIEDETFIWKKHSDVHGSIKIKFGTVNLIKIPIFSTFDNIMDIVLQKVQFYEKQSKELEDEKNNLESERRILIKKIEQYNKEKSCLEETLYSRFLTVLNTKKEKIESLQKHIQQPSQPLEPEIMQLNEVEEVPTRNKTKTTLPKRKGGPKEERKKNKTEVLLRTKEDTKSIQQGTESSDSNSWDYGGETQIDDAELDTAPVEDANVSIASLPKRRRKAT